MDDIQQGTPEWFAARLGRVTASKIADVMAKTKTGPSATRANYLTELAIQRATGVVEEGFKNDAMMWGTEQEPFARMAYEAATGNLVDQVGFVSHPVIEWSGASPDGLVDVDGLLEIKCPNSRTHWETMKSKKPAGKYVYQMQWQMACTGRKWCDFVSFDPRMPERSRLFIVRIDRDDEKIAEIEEKVLRFLGEVADEVKQMRGE